MSAPLARRNPRALSILGALAAALLAGCANDGVERLTAFRQELGQGDPDRSLAAVRSHLDLYGSESQSLLALDLGALHHFAGHWDSSLHWLAKAEEIQDALYARSVTNEAAALVTSDNLRPYRLRPYERVLLSQLQVVGNLAKGDVEGAMVDSRRGALMLDEWKTKPGYGSHGEAMLETFHWLAFTAGKERNDAVVSLRRSLEAWKTSSTPMPTSLRAPAAWRLAKEGFPSEAEPLGGPNQGRLEDNPEAAPAEVVVVSYLGRTPVIDQMRAWGTYLKTGVLSYYYNNPATGQKVFNVLPVPGIPNSGHTFSVNFTLPQFKDTRSQAASVEARLEDSLPRQAATLGSTQDFLKFALKEEESTVLLRTVTRVATRTLAAQKAKSVVQTGNPLMDLLLNLGVDAAQGQIEQSDVRVSVWMPRDIQILRIPLQPGTHRLVVKARNAGGAVVGEKTFDTLHVQAGTRRFLPVSFLY